MNDPMAELGQQLRVDAVRCAATAGSGHPTSSMSAADLAAVLLGRHLRCDFTAPDSPRNDRLVFSKGHATPLLYALYQAAGVLTSDELLTYRRLGSRLEGHPTPRVPFVDVATGSLGQGLPVAVGIAAAGQLLDRLPYRVWVLCGDSELAEGSMWEAAEQAAYLGLRNLVAIVDVNRLGQRGPTRHGWDTGAYARRFGAFGWHTVEVDGHDTAQIDLAYREAETADRPTAILARTRKGRGVAAVEDQEGAHGKPLPDPEEAVEELGGVRNVSVDVARPDDTTPAPRRPATDVDLPRFDVGDEVATRTAFGRALVAVGAARPDVVALDGEVSDSTRTGYFAEAYPDRFFECYIAEQQLVATAVGLQTCGWKPYVATFAAFTTRALDFVRMAAVGRADLCVVGSHAGVAIGPDGPSQMGLEDLACFRAVHGSTVLYPCDANQAAQLTALMADRAGISYLRTSRGDTPVVYDPDETFRVGGSTLLRSSDDDQVTVVAAGVTVPEAVRAADQLATEGVAVRVVDLYSVKPVDAPTLRAAAEQTGRIVTVEDHWPEGGIGDAVLDAYADAEPGPSVVKLAVRGMPGSASPAEQLRVAGIDATAIADAVRAFVKS